MIKAALFDLDGLLVNSEHLYFEANQAYFHRFGFAFTEDHHRNGTGKKFEQWIKTVVPLDKSGEEILSERNVLFYEVVREKLELLNGAHELLSALHGQVKTALVTSSKKDYVEFVFGKTGIHPYFDTVITGDMVAHGKPHPEGYLLAAEKLGVLEKECLVFEDAPSGVLAGKSAGMQVVAIPSPYVKGNVVYQIADRVFERLTDITLERLFQMEASSV